MAEINPQATKEQSQKSQFHLEPVVDSEGLFKSEDEDVGEPPSKRQKKGDDKSFELDNEDKEPIAKRQRTDALSSKLENMEERLRRLSADVKKAEQDVATFEQREIEIRAREEKLEEDVKEANGQQESVASWSNISHPTTESVRVSTDLTYGVISLLLGTSEESA